MGTVRDASTGNGGAADAVGRPLEERLRWLHAELDRAAAAGGVLPDSARGAWGALAAEADALARSASPDALADLAFAGVRVARRLGDVDRALGWVEWLDGVARSARASEPASLYPRTSYYALLKCLQGQMLLVRGDQEAACAAFEAALALEGLSRGSNRKVVRGILCEARAELPDAAASERFRRLVGGLYRSLARRKTPPPVVTLKDGVEALERTYRK